MDKCPLCFSAKLIESRARNGLALARCSACTLGFLKNQPQEGKLNKFYDVAGYYQFWGDLGQENIRQVEKCKKKTFGKTLDLIEKFKKNGRLLEIGCATGVLLESARERGWEVYGVECFVDFAQIAKKKVRGKIFQGMFEKAQFENGFFEVVILYDSIEHFVDPLKIIQKVFRILKKGGLIVVATPNLLSLSARLMGKEWTHFKAEHLFYFSPASIKKILRDNGFDILYLKSALKALSIAYMNSQFQSFPTPILTPLFKFLNQHLPSFLIHQPVFFSSGEMLVIGQKENL